MGIQDVLGKYQPIENEDNDIREAVKGVFGCSLGLKTATTKNEPVRPCYKLTLSVNQVFDGKAPIGKEFYRTYMKDDDASCKKLFNDLFTAGFSLPQTSIEDFESSFGLINGENVVIRAWGWTPEKKMDGAPIPVEERAAQQMFKIVNKKNVKAKVQKSEVPF